MRRASGDQAEGLRRLTQPHSARRTVALCAACAGVGKRSIARHLAGVMAQSGRGAVLLQGEMPPSEDPVRQRMQLLAQTASAQCAQDLRAQLERLTRSGPAGITALNVPELFVGLELWRGAHAAPVLIAMQQLAARSASLLLDLPLDTSCAAVRPLDTAVTLVVTPSAGAITSAYQMLKQAAQDWPQAKFQVIVNKARDLDEARQVFDNLAYATRRYLSGSIDFLGHVEHDAALQRAEARGLSLAEHSPTSNSARQLQQLAAALLRESNRAPRPTARPDALLAAVSGQRQHY